MKKNRLLHFRRWLGRGLVIVAGMGLVGAGPVTESVTSFQPCSAETSCDIAKAPTCCEADPAQDECSWCNLGEPYQLFDSSESDIEIGGWMQFGYHNQDNGMFNSHPDRFNAHQMWLYAEKAAESECGNWDWGFRADLMYGVDGPDTQAFGNRPGRWDFGNDLTTGGGYGWAIPQLYAEFAKDDLSIVVGHFYTLVGYEVVTAPDNFFYSHAYTMYNNEPFTHTGVLATYGVNDKVEVYGGWTLGWDTGFDQLDNGSNFLGGVSVSLTDDLTATYIATIGDFGWRGEGYSHSLVLDASLTDNLNYVFQTDTVRTNLPGDRQVDINQYLIYTVNDCLGVGTRIEWWSNNGDSQYEWTVGVNVKPHANFVVRPEIRHDWNPSQDDDFTTFGVDMILTF